MGDPSPSPGFAYDPEHVARFYDAYGEREWQRFDRSPAARVSLEIHRRLLGDFVKPGDRVLDAGAGPGRFTIELARLGAAVAVGDISPEQIRLNAEKVTEAGLEGAIEAREVLDITDLSRFTDESFDAVVCYGGPLSYVWEQADLAARELARVAKCGGHLLVSVMSNLGAHRRWLTDILKLSHEFGLETVDRVFKTGGLPAALNDGHAMRLFRYSELEALLNAAGCEVVAASAANCLTARIEPIEPMNDALWEMLLGWELRACREPGALDGGTHIVAVARRR
jgi:SAM-dependent methyltransferase